VPLTRLELPPAQAGYAVDPQSDTIGARMGAGPARFRRDQIGGVSLVSAQWRCSRLQFEVFEAFFRTTAPASMPFLVDLIIDYADPAEYEARLIPGSKRVSGVPGNARIVEAQLEVRPVAADAEVDAALVMLYGLYGDDAPGILNLLHELANETMPAAFP
jgi:hypothetical protein